MRHGEKRSGFSIFSLQGFLCHLEVTSALVATGRTASPAAVQWEDASLEGSASLAQGREQGLARGSPSAPASLEGVGWAQGSPCTPASPGDIVRVQGLEQGLAQGSPCTAAFLGRMVWVQGPQQGLARGSPCTPASPEGMGWAQESPCTPAAPGDIVQVQGKEQGFAQGSPCSAASLGHRLQPPSR